MLTQFVYRYTALGHGRYRTISVRIAILLSRCRGCHSRIRYHITWILPWAATISQRCPSVGLTQPEPASRRQQVGSCQRVPNRFVHATSYAKQCGIKLYDNRWRICKLVLDHKYTSHDWHDGNYKRQRPCRVCQCRLRAEGDICPRWARDFKLGSYAMGVPSRHLRRDRGQRAEWRRSRRDFC